MADIRSLDAFRKTQKKAKAAGNTLCKSGRHKWRIDTQRVFDTKQGKLVTREVCERCGKEKVKAH